MWPRPASLGLRPIHLLLIVPPCDDFGNRPGSARVARKEENSHPEEQTIEEYAGIICCVRRQASSNTESVVRIRTSLFLLDRERPVFFLKKENGGFNPLTNGENKHKITLLKTMMGRKTGFPALREPADAASRWGRPVNDCSRSFSPERTPVGRNGGPVTGRIEKITEGCPGDRRLNQGGIA